MARVTRTWSSGRCINDDTNAGIQMHEGTAETSEVTKAGMTA